MELIGEQLQCLVEKEVVQEAYDKASAEERRIESEILDVERKLAMDYGKDERFAQLVDQCFEFKEIEYVILDSISSYVGSTRRITLTRRRVYLCIDTPTQSASLALPNKSPILIPLLGMN